jgi:8-amino-7-oxononanoate synthase
MSTFQNIYSNALNLTKYLRQLPEQNCGENLDFSSNDYLGLSKHPELIQAAQDAALRYGVGSRGSRLVCGNYELLQEFESRIAADKGTEAAIIFNSGYQANQSVLSTLSHEKYLGEKPLLFFDKLNHASLYQAAFTNNAELIRYPHQDLDTLIALLEKHTIKNRPSFIVTETLFGMDGDVSDVKRLGAIAKQFGALLYLDEAHATGVLGDGGYGLSTIINTKDLPCVTMGTFSKGLGTSGAYIACSNIVKQYLVNHCPGLIYSTGLSPMVIGAAKAGWEMLPQLEDKRQSLLQMSCGLRGELQSLGLDTGLSTTHIIPIIVSDAEKALSIQAQLKQRKILVSAIRPPSVPSNSSRLRIALNINHTEEDLTKLINALQETLC